MAESKRLRLKFPGRIPVLVQRARRSDLPLLTKTKFLVPKDLSVRHFQHVIRQRMRLPPSHSLLLFVGGVLPAASSLMCSVDQDHRDEDGFLRMQYASESVFG
jgi:GABA(A) receptor-associated protein